MDAWWQWEGEDLLLRLRIQPRAGRDAFAEPYADAFKIRITAPPVDGRANKHLQRFLAKAFDVTLKDVQIEAGEASRGKRVRIQAPKRIPPELQAVANQS
ncbi:MAG: YggU family protein [Gammaproteobacteria bacterium]|nr:YggU family protein [Gammaproteobacteria bacterium]MBU1655863.1 YggU family protein [Gammaproteobacteria bacterium]MBU1960606.1 YggU family protein [Gammaproteobacteria bacterium]